MIVVQADTTTPGITPTAPPDRFYKWDATSKKWVKDAVAYDQYLRILKDRAIAKINAELQQKTAIPAYYATKVAAANDILKNLSTPAAAALKAEVDERKMGESYVAFAKLVIAKNQEHFTMSCKLDGIAKRKINLIESAITAEAIAGMV